MHTEMGENLRRIEHILYYEIGPLMKYLNIHRSISFLDIQNKGLEIIFGKRVLYKEDDMPPMSPEEKFEKAIYDNSRPMTTGVEIGSKYYIGNLPRYFTIFGNQLFFNNRWSERTICRVGIRENGPGAWAPSIDIPVGAFYRRTEKNGQISYAWFRVKEQYYAYIEIVGNGIDVIQIKDDNGEQIASWTSYIAYDIDLG